MQVGKLIRLDLQKGTRETEKNHIKNLRRSKKLKEKKIKGGLLNETLAYYIDMFYIVLLFYGV